MLVACRSGVGAGSEPAGSELLHVVILHTNDIHGQLLPRRSTRPDSVGAEYGGLTRLAACVDRVRAEATSQGAHVLLVDAGDWYAGTPEGALDQGAEFVKALAQLDYDMVCPGNHDLDHGLPNFKRLLGLFGDRAAVANLYTKAASTRVPYLKPWRIVRAKGLNVALVGLLTPHTPSITHPDARGIDFWTPESALSQARAELAGTVDWIVPVGHIDLEEGRIVAQAHPDLDLIVTGHSHTFLREERRVGNVLLVQAGARAAALGRVDVWLDPRTKRAVRTQSSLIDLDQDEPPSARSERIAKVATLLTARSSAEMDVEVGVLDAALSRGNGPRSTVAGNWIADLLRARTGAQIGVHNRGGTRTDLPGGPVTKRDMFELLPFDNWIVVQTLTGDELFELVRQAVEGVAHSGLDYSGLRAFVTETDGAPRLERVEIAGQPLDRAGAYRVATNSFLANGGDGYRAFDGRRERQEDPMLLRELAIAAFGASRRVQPPSEERIQTASAGAP